MKTEAIFKTIVVVVIFFFCVSKNFVQVIFCTNLF